MEVTTQRGSTLNGSDYYAYLTHKWIELDSDGKGTSGGVPAMNAIE